MTIEERNQALPPKTCEIERLVTVPADVEKVIAGRKTATRRNGRYADIGEIMTLKGHQFVVENVYAQTLGELTEQNAAEEGYGNLEEYKQSILSIHPGMPWLPHMSVWVHEFRAVEN
ncbi:ASCH domain-containing protein [Bacillus solimangrovi]|uniref:Fructose-1-phosphate kinase n=1 Tax=Bacillus solimangrovi TaxID=1305675 RepID=A0A1E5LJM3_9BACI|nr:ASCH domain-containing protein [Bacillus solimangrovi]OEH94299.1 fructose-1-phosphate kinase [Bacillus solimangrovi]